jgi:hypothetical protein
MPLLLWRTCSRVTNTPTSGKHLAAGIALLSDTSAEDVTVQLRLWPVVFQTGRARRDQLHHWQLCDSTIQADCVRIDAGQHLHHLPLPQPPAHRLVF